MLFLCRDNSASGVIAEALLRELAGHRFEAFSAGPEPAARVHPLAVAQLRSGVSARDILSPKSWLEFTGEWAPRMDLIIALDESVDEHHAPVFPGAPSLLAWSVADPLVDGVPDDERVRLFDKMFWQIVRQVSALIALPKFDTPRGQGGGIGNKASTALPASDARCTDSGLASPPVEASLGTVTVNPVIVSAEDRATTCDS
ncbi:arsenate-mycothiol transferase ArsC [Paraburkholderia sediminicola]|uniref:arsenate-mycothiol transferase ArsC n=1 Tax=Paraburkholderia sediminicola TaxID=458836 RepID=UPI0038B9E141